MQERLLQEVKIYEAELEKKDKALKTLAAKKDSYERQLRRSTESTQKRQFLEQEIEVDRAKEGVSQRRIRLEYLH